MLQLDMIEVTQHLTSKKDHMGTYEKVWSSQPDILSSFCSISPQNFEADSIKFLNLLNGSAGDKATSVTTYPNSIA